MVISLLSLALGPEIPESKTRSGGNAVLPRSFASTRFAILGGSTKIAKCFRAEFQNPDTQKPGSSDGRAFSLPNGSGGRRKPVKIAANSEFTGCHI
ncbi:hypothetical protein [Labrys sp. WJW]|uniref:hypothetical protein n=1 Tax=Labrys sp. WJW TaxID=1737983 RepID=UPI0012EAD931|nr:hypothetical protein [Labrys sp. WJW]